MQVQVRLKREVITVPPSLLITHCWTIMQRETIRHLPVVDGGKLVGMLSDRDLLRLGTPQPNGELTFVRRHVEDVMTVNPHACGPETSVGEIARIMTEEKIDSVPIVADERLVGLVTSTDLLYLLVENRAVCIPFDFQLDTRTG